MVQRMNFDRWHSPAAIQNRFVSGGVDREIDRQRVSSKYTRTTVVWFLIYHDRGNNIEFVWCTTTSPCREYGRQPERDRFGR